MPSKVRDKILEKKKTPESMLMVKDRIMRRKLGLSKLEILLAPSA
jgi:hypothetical protein